MTMTERMALLLEKQRGSSYTASGLKKDYFLRRRVLRVSDHIVRIHRRGFKKMKKSIGVGL